ncbi:hypothetical protein CU100_09280 [Phyllobacterium endophyticum]|uniref:Uncharacterized protein n=2 Tax=Phyllobacterium endophyticum TaxID=1149773 RepID=A0A2P7AUI7_9HYPH|nr:hypothetical protein CU100_09280 [Phyllobacterium endophyticum]
MHHARSLFQPGCGIFDLDAPERCSHFVLMTKTITTLGQAARHGMLVRSRCLTCNKSASFTAGSLAEMFGHGRDIRSLKFKCRDCNSTKCEVLPYEELSKRPAIPKPVQVQTGTSDNGTIGALIDNGYKLWAHCYECRHSRKMELALLEARLGRSHSAMHKDLAPKLKCSACGSKNLGLSATPY